MSNKLPEMDKIHEPVAREPMRHRTRDCINCGCKGSMFLSADHSNDTTDVFVCHSDACNATRAEPKSYPHLYQCASEPPLWERIAEKLGKKFAEAVDTEKERQRQAIESTK